MARKQSRVRLWKGSPLNMKNDSSRNDMRNSSVFRMLIFTLFSGIAFYCIRSILRPSGYSHLFFSIAFIWLVLQFAFAVAQPLYFWNRTTLPRHKKWADFFQEAGYFAIHNVSVIFVLVAVRDLIGFALWFLAENNWISFDAAQMIYNPWASTMMIWAPIIFFILGHLNIRIGPFIEKVTISDERLPRDLHGFKIAQLSDIHFGLTMKDAFVKSILQQLEKMDYDILTLTGDIIDCHPKRFPDRFWGLHQFKARHGVYYCLGNHEYYWNLPDVIEEIQKSPARLLVNQVHTIEVKSSRLHISGIADPASHHFNGVEPVNWEKVAPHPSLKTEHDFHLLLAHQPFQADTAVDYGFHLQLSGHTHAGQFFPWTLLIYFFQRYNKGLFSILSESGHKMNLYVNQGTGFWGPPTRLGSKAEITLIELKNPNF